MAKSKKASKSSKAAKAAPFTESEIEKEVLGILPGFEGKKKKESEEDYRARIVHAVNVEPEDSWDSLSEDAQAWVNSGAKAIKKGETVPDFPDLEDDEGDDEEPAPKKGEGGKSSSKKSEPDDDDDDDDDENEEDDDEDDDENEGDDDEEGDEEGDDEEDDDEDEGDDDDDEDDEGIDGLLDLFVSDISISEAKFLKAAKKAKLDAEDAQVVHLVGSGLVERLKNQKLLKTKK